MKKVHLTVSFHRHLVKSQTEKQLAQGEHILYIDPVHAFSFSFSETYNPSFNFHINTSQNLITAVASLPKSKNAYPVL